MAKSTSVESLDDLTGDPAEETVRFALDGVQYDIDLSGENAENLREVLSRFVDNARRTGGRKRAARMIVNAKGGKTATKRQAATSRTTKTQKAVAAGKTTKTTPKQQQGKSKANAANATGAKTSGSAKPTSAKAAPSKTKPAKQAKGNKRNTQSGAAKTTNPQVAMVQFSAQ